MSRTDNKTLQVDEPFTGLLLDKASTLNPPSLRSTIDLVTTEFLRGVIGVQDTSRQTLRCIREDPNETVINWLRSVGIAEEDQFTARA